MNKGNNKAWGGLLLLCLLTVAAYYPGLSGPFLLDDFENLADVLAMQQGSADTLGIVMGNQSGVTGRPVSMFSFVAGAQLCGVGASCFKWVNLLLHLLCGLLIFTLSRQLLRHVSLIESGSESRLALWVTALWLLSPLLLSTTLYVVQRMAQLSTLFVLAGLICYWKAREVLDRKGDGHLFLWEKVSVTFSLFLAYMVFLPLAIFSKENGILLPALILVTEVYIGGFQVKRRRWLISLHAVVAGLPMLALLVWLIADPWWLQQYHYRDFTPWQRLLTEARVLLDYGRQLLIPYTPEMGIYHDDVEISRGLLQPVTTLTSVLFWGCVVGLHVGFRIVPLRLLLFGLVFFLVGHGLESTILSLELVFEHRNYLPSLGVYFTLVVLSFSLLTRLNKHRWHTVLMAAWALAFAVALLQRSLVWQSYPSIVESAAAHHPRSYRLKADQAALYFSQGRVQQAMQALDELSILRPTAVLGAFFQGLAGHCRANASIPDSLYQRLPLRWPSGDARLYTLWHFRDWLALVRAGRCAKVDLSRLAELFETPLRDIAASHPKAVWTWNYFYGFAEINRKIGRWDAATEWLQHAIAVQPDRIRLRILLAVYLLEAGRLELARSAIDTLRGDSTVRKKANRQLLESISRTIDKKKR